MKKIFSAIKGFVDDYLAALTVLDVLPEKEPKK